MRYIEFCSKFNMTPGVKSLDAAQFLIYFLIHNGVIVYVGKSSEIRLAGRLTSHKQDKEFDSFFLIQDVECESRAIELEKMFISSIRPKYNKAGLDRAHLRKKIKTVMSRNKTRHNFTLDAESLRILAELAAARGVSISQLIGQLAREEAARWAKNSEL